MAGTSAVPVLARRFLLSKASDRFLSFIAWVSVVGIALGVLALTVVTSVINGFEGELVHVITGMNGDVILYSRGDPVRNPEQIEKKIEAAVPETQALTASFVTELMAAGQNGVAGAVLEGFDPQTIGDVTSIPKQVIQGTLPTGQNEIAIGSALAQRLGAQVGSKIRLIAPFVGTDFNAPEGGPKQEGMGAPKVIPVTVSGIVKMGMYEYDSKFLFAPLASVQQYLGRPGEVTAFKLKLMPGADARAASDRLSDSFGYPFRAKDWGQLNQNLFYAIQLEKAVIAIILTVIVIVAAFNVVSTLMMMIHDKTKEIAILKAMGLRRGQSFRLFLLIGMGIGVIGTVVGVLCGIGVNWVLKSTHLIDLPADIYYISYLPVVVRWSEIALIAVLALVTTFIATVYPAFRVSTRPPLDGLRYE
jgi:lipoprotein-releasing system permease protein